MKLFSIRYKNTASEEMFSEIMFFGGESFDYEQLFNLFKSISIDISQNTFLKGQQLDKVQTTLKQELKKLLSEKDSLKGQYPKQAKRDLNVEIFGERIKLNVRNQWHNYIITLYELHETICGIIKTNGEICFLHDIEAN